MGVFVADIHHVSINVTDTGRSVAFYTDVLGLGVLDRPDFGFAGAWLDVGGGRQLHLIEAPVPPDQGQHFAFLVDDIDAAVAVLSERGVDVVGPKSVGGTAARQAFFADPDGNRLELNQPTR